MKRIRITHETRYHYHEPVRFGTHRAMMRPREGHDIRIVRGLAQIEPKASIRWLRDVYDNSVAVVDFEEPARQLRIRSEVDVELYDDPPVECLIDPGARTFPFQYAPAEQLELTIYRLPSYPYDGPALQTWLSELYCPGQIVETFDLLNRLNSRIHGTLRYNERHAPGVQLPHETLALGSGSCRDYAVLMMEAARYWGFGARFVTGYIQLNEGQHGATHAWTEIYVPGAGWHGFDPTNDKRVGSEHVPVAVAREQEKATPLSGSWSGSANAFDRMEVSVQVVAL